MTNRVTALLPMKGNSDRVPGKNLKDFNGKPLYYWVLNELVKSKFISKVIINTDSDLIRESVNKYFKEKIVFHDRPVEIQGDFVSMNDIIADDLMSSSADIFIQTHSTNPLLKVETIDKAIKDFITNKESSCDSIFSVTKLQSRLYDLEVNAVNHNPQELIRTQDLPPLFEENSNFYIFTKKSFNKAGRKRIGLNPKISITDRIEGIDIDEPNDFLIAEAIHKLFYSNEK